MRIGGWHAFVLVAVAIPGIVPAEAADTSGSGVVVGIQGEILTNSHVVENCAIINIRLSSGGSETAAVIARDQRNDLAVVRASKPLASVALGYPLGIKYQVQRLRKSVDAPCFSSAF
jgi:S1-C subfamily serine protease